jgi:hypothetical protein
MTILVKFADGISRIQNVDECYNGTRAFETLHPDHMGWCKVEFKGHLLGRVPVYEETSTEETT